MRVSVIGGAGVLGNMVIPSLLHRHDVRVLDRVASTIAGAESIVGDALDADDVGRAVRGAEVVVDQAVLVPRGALADDDEVVRRAVEVNVGSAYLAARAAVRCGASSFIHVSTMGVFASYSVRRIERDDVPDSRHPYGLTKRLAEQAVAAAVAEATGADFGACSLRLAFPTPDELWPRWRPPVGDIDDVRMGDGTPVPGTSGSDVARAVEAAMRYRGPYRAFPISGDLDEVSVDREVTRSLLGWSPLRSSGDTTSRSAR